MASAGRPREFDIDVALDRAVLVFWERGFEGASLTELTAGMGISRKSMYAAFGSKNDLFAKALARYTEGPAAYTFRALTEPTARAVAFAYLHGCVEASTRPGLPAGCLVVQGALASSEACRSAHTALVEWRDEARSRLRERFEKSVSDGDLAADTDCEVLARYLVTVANGLAVQAAGGAGRRELEAVVNAVLEWLIITDLDHGLASKPPHQGETRT